MPRALLSVTNKQGLAEFAGELHARGWTLVSTGGTARVLRDTGLPVTEVSEITGHPEILGGRVKTLHPAVHAGLLARRRHAADDEQMLEHAYEPIDLVAVNLYAFEEAAARPGITAGEATEQIDIGGPAMLRSAAKNHAHVWAVADPADYPAVLKGLQAAPEEAARLRRRLAARVFAHTARYDAAIADFLNRALSDDLPEPADAAGAPPAHITLRLDKVQDLRYGENPGQQAALYARSGSAPRWRQLHGKALSYNNLLDLDAALLAVSAWPEQETAACAIIKHNTPCGLAVGATAAEAYRKALQTDPTSAFGSVVAFNTPIDEAAAELLRPNFVEAIAAPGFTTIALDRLRAKKNLRLLIVEPTEARPAWEMRGVRGAVLLQSPLRVEEDESGWRVASARAPSANEWEDLRFAWRAIATVKSNAILLAQGGMALGIGTGQTSRVDAARLAVAKAHEQGFALDAAALASDAFFPFRDGVDAAAEAGIRAIVQPGGSVRDDEVISAADERGIAMVFTGQRLFRH